MSWQVTSFDVCHSLEGALSSLDQNMGMLLTFCHVTALLRTVLWGGQHLRELCCEGDSTIENCALRVTAPLWTVLWVWLHYWELHCEGDSTVLWVWKHLENFDVRVTVPSLQFSIFFQWNDGDVNVALWSRSACSKRTMGRHHFRWQYNSKWFCPKLGRVTWKSSLDTVFSIRFLKI